MLRPLELDLSPLRPFAELARSFGQRTFLVGGVLRDALLGITHPPDLDLVVDGDVLPLLKAWKARTGDLFIPLDPDWGIYRLFTRGGVLDVARMQGSIEEDLRRRDLSVNALGFGPLAADPSLLDPTGGLDDLEARRIRVIARENLEADPLRLLRVFRFAATLGFEIEAKTLAWVRELASTILEVSAERVAGEWFKMCQAPAYGLLGAIKETGLLFSLFPELGPLGKIPPNEHHQLDALGHSLEAVRTLEALLEEPSWLGDLALPLEENLRDPLAKDRPRLPALKLAALLHDVGKAPTYFVQDGRPRFIGHDLVGGEITEKIARRLKLSSREREFLAGAVRHHMRPGLLSSGGEVSARAVYRFFRDTGEDGPAILLLAMADRLAAQGPGVSEEDNEKLRALVLRMLGDYFEKPNLVAPTPLLDGREVMKALGISPGPRVGEWLERLKEAQVAGQVGTKEEALAFLRELTAD